MLTLSYSFSHQDTFSFSFSLVDENLLNFSFSFSHFLADRSTNGRAYATVLSLSSSSSVSNVMYCG